MSTHSTKTYPASPKKLRSGDWGALVESAHVEQGDIITITTRSGKSWDATVAKVIWRGDGKAIVATKNRDRDSQPFRFVKRVQPVSESGGPASCTCGRHRAYRECRTGGNCSSVGDGRNCGGCDCDGY